MSSISTDKQKINELLSRSVDTIYPSTDELREKLLQGEKLRVYMGIDPTNTYAHLGHATNYLTLKRFHDLGHSVVALVGDFTAMIGDPSDKDAARKRLTKEEVVENVKTFKEQIGTILPLDDKENPVEFRFNNEWLAKLTFEEIVDIASNFTVQQMIQRDVFERRLEEEKPLFVHEFFYPLMQGYDSVALDVDVEVGGTDQTFNMLAGRTLQKRYNNKEKYVITTTLLENPATGEKLMSKSKGTGVPLDGNPTDIYGGVMALPDEGIAQCFVDCTEVPMSEVEKIIEGLAEGAHPKEVKMRLAREIVTMLYNEEEARQAEEAFESTFRAGDVPDDAQEVKLEAGETYAALFVRTDVITSTSEARRLGEQQAITNMDTNTKVEDVTLEAKPGTYKIGKRRFLRII